MLQQCVIFSPFEPQEIILEVSLNGSIIKKPGFVCQIGLEEKFVLLDTGSSVSIIKKGHCLSIQSWIAQMCKFLI